MKAPSTPTHTHTRTPTRTTTDRRDATLTTISTFLTTTLALGSLTTGGLTLLPQTAQAETTTVKKVSASKVRETPGGAKYVDVKVGEGENPHKGDFLIISYTAYLPDGTIFDGLHAVGKKPLAFKYGTNQVIPGIEEVLLTMKPGGERQALVPADLAFGEKGVCTDKGECLVPPNSNIKLDIILKRVAVSPI